MSRTRVFVASDFDHYARKQRWTDAYLIRVVGEIESGLSDGDLGSNIVKRRIARPGAGKSAGFRVVVVFRMGDRAIFIEAFAKNVKTKHSPQEVRALRMLADSLLKMPEESLRKAVKAGVLREIMRGEESDEEF